MDWAGSGAFGSRSHELYRLDRVLAQLTRPAVASAGVPADLSDQLRSLGVLTDGSIERRALIAEVWCRKRPLLVQVDGDDDLLPPCA